MATGTNVGPIERVLSAVAGGALALYALINRRSTPAAVAGAAVGSALLLRGASGHCPLYTALGIDTARPSDDGDDVRIDLVEQASVDSFPASDAPSWTPTTSVGNPES